MVRNAMVRLLLFFLLARVSIDAQPEHVLMERVTVTKIAEDTIISVVLLTALPTMADQVTILTTVVTQPSPPMYPSNVLNNNVLNIHMILKEQGNSVSKTPDKLHDHCFLSGYNIVLL